MKIVRWLIGRVILLLDFVFTPRSKKRSVEQQKELDGLTQTLKLYQFKACPFCVKVRRTIKREGLNIETRDAKNDLQYRQELSQQGGKIKVPCLRIEHQDQVTWLYESNEIVRYLETLEKAA